MNRLQWAMALACAGYGAIATAAPGDLDLTFGGTGIAIADFGTAADRGQSLALSGTDVVIGGYTGYFTDADFVYQRLNDAGLPQLGFTHTFNGDPASGHTAEKVLVDGSGRIVLLGPVNGRYDNAEIGILRLLPDGITPDATFDGDGELVIDLGTDARAFDAVFDGSGNIVLAGTDGTNGIVARVTPAGALDATFGTAGIATIPGQAGQSVAIDGSGRIVVASSNLLNLSGTQVTRMTSTGALDGTFGAGGTFGVAVNGGYALLVDGSDRVVVVGTTPGAASFSVARLTTAGALDATFNGTGLSTADIGPGFDIAYGVGLDSGGGIVAGGAAGGNSAVVRILDDGTLDPMFGTAGVVELDIQAGSLDAAYDVLVDAMDRILLGGRVHTGAGNGYDFYVARLEGGGVADADLSVTLSDAPDPVNAGTNLTYTAVATNNGPADADTVTVTLPLPAGTTFVSANADGGGTCNAVSPVVCTWAGLTANGVSRTATIVAAVSPSATGTLNATVTVASNTPDPNAANDTAMTTTGINVVADLSITKTNGTASSTPGQNTVYTIVASNIGPSDALASTVTDTFPAACTTVTWTCVGAGGGTCTANGSGNINDAVNLPLGASVTYTATCAIDPAAVGTLDNTATVAVAGGVTDPVAGNNSATDSDTLTASADVSVTKVATGVPTPVLVGSSFVYQLTASNAGPSTATGVVVSDSLPLQVDHVSNDCGAAFADPTLTWNVGTLAPAASAVCNVTVVVADLGQIVNSSSYASPPELPSAPNHRSTDPTTGAEETDMSVTLTSNVAGALAVGEGYVYSVTGTNNGPGTAFGI
ncbi:MAG: DUF11 domain-containing protein, partial [Xanthomonadales bacterium]|nr:DUF11 domain-containing protein [Xanthomonadales bacterium]